MSSWLAVYRSAGAAGKNVRKWPNFREIKVSPQYILLQQASFNFTVHVAKMLTPYDRCMATAKGVLWLRLQACYERVRQQCSISAIAQLTFLPDRLLFADQQSFCVFLP